MILLNRHSDDTSVTSLEDIVEAVRRGAIPLFTEYDNNYWICEFRYSDNNTSVYVNSTQKEEILAAFRVAVEHIFPTDQSTLSQEEENLLQRVIDNTHQEIPVNSNTWLINDTTSRFSGAAWYSEIQNQHILLLGAGGIGSFVAFLLSRIHPRHITIYDPDIVESANLSGQFFNIENLGDSKESSIIKNMVEYSQYFDAYGFKESYTMASPSNDIVICGFDNMEARKVAYINWIKRIEKLLPEESKKCIFIDGRLALEEFQIYAIKGDDMESRKRYLNEALFRSDEAEHTVCSMKQTTFMSNMIASYMVNIFVNFIANQLDPFFPRPVPYHMYYNAETMYSKIEI